MLGDDADRFRAVEVAQQAERLAVVLGDLVGDVAEARRGDGKLGELAVARRLHDGPGGGRDEEVGARLVIAVGDALRRPGAGDEAGDDAFGSGWRLGFVEHV